MEFAFVERLRTVVCCGAGRDESCPDKWSVITSSANLKRCPKCHKRFKYRNAKAKERLKKYGSAALRRGAYKERQ